MRRDLHKLFLQVKISNKIETAPGKTYKGGQHNKSEKYGGADYGEREAVPDIGAT